MSPIDLVKKILVCLFLFLSISAFSQDDKIDRDSISPEPEHFEADSLVTDTLTEDFTTDSIPTIVTKKEKPADSVEVKKPKPKKKKKKVFYGLKCRKGFARKGEGAKAVIELFYTLKTYKDP